MNKKHSKQEYTNVTNLDFYRKNFKELEKILNVSPISVDFHDACLLKYTIRNNNFYMRYDACDWFYCINREILGNLLPELLNETLVIDLILYDVKVRHYVSEDYDYNEISSNDLDGTNVFKLNFTDGNPDQYFEIEFKNFEWKIFDLIDNKTYRLLYSDLYDENVKDCILRNFDYSK